MATMLCNLAIALSMYLVLSPITILATQMNVIDRCWRTDPNWWSNRQQLAKCSVGFAGVACFLIYKASEVIIHGLYIHHCRAEQQSSVMGPNGKIMQLGKVDGDAIRLVSASKVWIDHNTLYECEDGLIDIIRGSTDVTISNNWLRNQDKVMLLGHDDGYIRDTNMKVTVAFNHFGPNCNQRMPRFRHGFAHVANNLYQGWTQYAIGGSMSPSIKSQSNLFIAPKSGNKEVIWRLGSHGSSWKFDSGGMFSKTELLSEKRVLAVQNCLTLMSKGSKLQMQDLCGH
ncbi:hypothetical protein Dsin_005735 [Dipteronia sinensis]|uniref:Pectate lyase n=1 Tax=Dipteronia sinensis TaxID=43782 RepID=A0AAE0AXV4_9ROSI|nr:hypothetical protein Dsin_005735 [Dipteronia sinensis]